MYLMIESGIRGGMSVVTCKYAKANNKLLDDYDPNKPSSHCIYLDANNLYGWAMSQKMPYDNHQWLSEEEILNLNIKDLKPDADVGYIFEVDLEYPCELHDLHNDFPLAPVRRKVKSSEWSPYTSHLSEEFHKVYCSEKLIADLHHKTRYVIHYRNLQLYMRLGLRLKKVHRAIKFSQSYWLRDYIQLNTEKRKKASNAFEKDFFKLMNNSVFGKTMENVRKRIDLKLVSEKKKLSNCTKKPQFLRTTIITPDLVAVRSLVTRIKLNKPIYVGFCILDISKILMYEFHYDVIKQQYNNNATLCFTDTDSLLYHITTEDIYRDMAAQANLYDTSDYPEEHYLYNTVNKKVLGKMKDELAGTPVSEFVGLRSKMYSVKTRDGERKTAKGISRATIRKRLRHDMYRNCLLTGRTTSEVVRSIRSKNHQIYSIAQKKLALSSFDDKRFVLNDKCNTRAHGHYLNLFT